MAAGIGAETQQPVRIGSKTYFADCAGDAFGISATLKRDPDKTSICPDRGGPLSLHCAWCPAVEQFC